MFVVIVVYTVTEPALLALKKPKNRSEALTMWRGLLHNDPSMSALLMESGRPGRSRRASRPATKTARDARSLRARRPLCLST